jgi:hypothetical protein
MIDCENEVYSMIAARLRHENSLINISSVYLDTPSSFPHVSIEMKDNAIMAKTMDSGDYEVSVVIFEINIFSNKEEGRKTEAKKIAKVIDDLLRPYNFRRMALTPVPNMEDNSIYRIVARYRVATDGKNFYRR